MEWVQVRLNDPLSHTIVPGSFISILMNTNNDKMSTREDAKKAIYIGNLPTTGITQQQINDIFALAGDIKSIKLIGKSTLNTQGNYAFIEYDDPAAAQTAIDTMNGKWYAFHLMTGRTLFGSTLKVNWAFQPTSLANAREETASHFTIFCGDLAPEVKDEDLAAAFNFYATVSDARVMWDMTTGRSRGYGFVAFKDRSDAERAIEEMNGAYIGSRAIRINWAKIKQTTPTTQVAIVGEASTTVAPMSFQCLSITQQYTLVLNQAPYQVTTIYIGNLSADTEAVDLMPLFDVYGDAEDIKMHADRGFAFAKLKTHDTAALAIVQLQGVIVKGRPIKCSCT